jgi:hypothetical protein
MTSTLHPDYFIYEADPVRYVVFRLRDGVSVHVGERAVKPPRTASLAW